MKEIAAFLLAFIATLSCAQTVNDGLRQGFEDPPQVARPRVWWHWMDGNVTKEGIKLDLEWMRRVNCVGRCISAASARAASYLQQPRR